MNRTHRYLIEQALDDALSPGEQKVFEKLLNELPELAQQFAVEQQLHGYARIGAASAFDPGFLQRAVRRLDARQAAPSGLEGFGEAILLLVRRFTMVPITAVILLAIYNVYTGYQVFGAEVSALERLFALPPITFEMLLGI